MGVCVFKTTAAAAGGGGGGGSLPKAAPAAGQHRGACTWEAGLQDLNAEMSGLLGDMQEETPMEKNNKNNSEVNKWTKSRQQDEAAVSDAAPAVETRNTAARQSATATAATATVATVTAADVAAAVAAQIANVRRASSVAEQREAAALTGAMPLTPPVAAAISVLVCHSDSLPDSHKANVASNMQRLFPQCPIAMGYHLFTDSSDGRGLISSVHRQKGVTAIILTGKGVLSVGNIPLFELLGRAYTVIATIDAHESKSAAAVEFKEAVSPGLIKFVEGFDNGQNLCVAISSVVCQLHYVKPIQKNQPKYVSAKKN
jgi:hypothetical protein